VRNLRGNRLDLTVAGDRFAQVAARYANHLDGGSLPGQREHNDDRYDDSHYGPKNKKQSSSSVFRHIRTRACATCLHIAKIVTDDLGSRLLQTGYMLALMRTRYSRSSQQCSLRSAAHAGFFAGNTRHRCEFLKIGGLRLEALLVQRSRRCGVSPDFPFFDVRILCS
jgi:hypothetical protein